MRPFCHVALAAFTVFAASPATRVPRSPAPASDDAVLTATLDDQVDLAVTVYNSNIALVRDVRRVGLPGGVTDLRLLDIAATVNPATVHVRSLTEPSRLGVLEQNYQFDLLDPDRLLRKYIGRDVKLLRRYDENGTTREREVTARLLAYNQAPVWRIDNEIVTGLHADQLRFPEIPPNLHSRPTLVWRLDNSGATQHRLETSYLAGNMSWTADYVLTVGRDDTRGDLDGWVTVSNTSGTSYRNASLQLVAGDVHRLPESRAKAEETLERMADVAAALQPFAREAFSEYHLYTLGRRTSLAENETKQISLLNATGVPVRKRFVVNGQRFYYRNRQEPGAPLRDDVAVYYAFRNAEASRLGMPMPAGTVRVYQADSKGGLQFAGEDRIDHTPKDEELTLKIGTAFDLVCERKQTDFVRVADNVYELAFAIALRNHKAASVGIEVNEPIAGDWHMLSSSHTATKTDAFAAKFLVDVPANGESLLTYRVRVRY